MRRRRFAAVGGPLAIGLGLIAAGCGSGSGASGAAAGGGVGGGSGGGGGGASSKGGTVDIGLLVPLTGPFAETGQEQKLGAQLAVDAINRSGGVMGLGGKKLQLVVRDAGSSTADTVNAAASLLSSNDIVAGLGTGATASTLAATSVTEQHHVPWMDLSFGDQITERGFKYVFITSPLQSTLDSVQYPAFGAVAKAAHVDLKRIGIIAGESSSAVQSAADLRKIYAPKLGWSVALNETVAEGSVTSGVASGLVSKIQSSHVQALMAGSSPSDVAAIQKQEIAQGAPLVPWSLAGAPFLSKGFLTDTGKKGVQGMIVTASAGVYPSDKSLAAKIDAAGQVANEYNLVPYSEVYLIADALNAAKSTDHTKLRDAIAALNVKGGPAGSVWPCNCMRFNSTGRTSTSVTTLQQWQNGRPVTIYPKSVAQAPAIFPKGE